MEEEHGGFESQKSEKARELVRLMHRSIEKVQGIRGRQEEEMV